MAEPVKMRLMVRGYKKRVLLFAEPLDVDADQIDEVIPVIAEQHAEAMLAGTLGMIEFEWLDEPDPLQRFTRIGVETEGMVRPMAFRPGKEN